MTTENTQPLWKVDYSRKFIKEYNEEMHVGSGLTRNDLYSLDESEVEDYEAWYKRYYGPTAKPLWKVLNELRENKGWRQGQTLPTKQTQKWDVEKWMANDDTEKRIVFSHFREEDEGRSRVKIAVFENITDAQYATLAENNLHHLAEALGELVRTLEPLINNPIHSNVMDKAKEALNRISKYK